MRIGSLLLNQEDLYLIEGRLPLRPEGDKELLKYLCEKAKGITYSPNTGPMLPEWAKKPAPEWDLNLGIATLTDKPDILLINRVNDVGEGKQFNLNGWKKIEVEVWLQE